MQTQPQTNITFATKTQAAIFEFELTNQISDGKWENTHNTSWQMWCAAKVLVGENVGRFGFYPRKDNFNFASKDLVECVGDRMISYARLALVFDLSEVGKIQNVCVGFNDCSFSDIPDSYKGEYWDKKREFRKTLDLPKIKAALENDSYGMKQLMADLKEIKKTIKVVRN